MNGGYVLIDCEQLDLTKGSTEQEISGIYAKLQKAMSAGKPIYACNCIWGTGKAVTPIQCMAIQLYESTIVATAATLQIWVTEEDVVTIVNLVGD